MIKSNDVVKKVEVYHSDNCGDDSGDEGMDVHITFENGETVVQECEWISELADQPYGVYLYDGEKYIQIENWEE
jgi:hypothetical protein